MSATGCLFGNSLARRAPRAEGPCLLGLGANLAECGFGNGPSDVKPPSDCLVAGLVLPSVVGTGAATSCGQKRSRWAHLRRVVHPGGAPQHYPRPHRFPRPGDGTSEGRERPAPNSCFPLRSCAVASSPPRKSVPFAHMRCRTPASLRASAILARFMPRRLATPMAQRLSAETPLLRVSIA